MFVFVCGFFLLLWPGERPGRACRRPGGAGMKRTAPLIFAAIIILLVTVGTIARAAHGFN